MVNVRQQSNGEKEECPSGASVRMKQASENDDLATEDDDSCSGGSDHVVPDWSSIQGKLFGRQDQQQLLQEAFQRKVTTNQRELVLVTGSSGTGKTALARTLSEHSDFFIHGKFDQLQKPSPYFALVQAVGDFINLVVEKGEVETVKEAIEDSLEASEIAQLVHSIPDLGRILKTDAIRMAQVAQNRFIFAFCKLIGALCSKERPLVLFLDDLQWSDAGSLEVVEALTRDVSIQEGLVILGCCRGDEVKLDDHLAVMLRSLDSDRIHITDIQVTNLPREEVNKLIAEVLCDATAQANRDLGQVIYSYTQGNIFFTIQLLQSLSEESLLVKCKGGWDMQRIKEAHIPEDVTEFIKTKLLRFDREMQDLLKIVACLGAEVEESLIYHLVGKESAEPIIAIAVSKGLVTTGRGNVYFAHDCIQLASLALIPADEKESFHLLLGRQLLASMTPEELENNLFLVTNQLCLGAKIIMGVDERYAVSALCLRAGIRATKSSAFFTASTYLELGIELLGARHWRDEYRLSLDLYRATAEVASSKGEFEQVDQLLNGIFENARCFHDKIPAFTIQVYALGSRSEYHQAIDVGLEVLAQLGETFPKRARVIHIILAYLKTKKMLRNKSDSDILNMPLMQDENKLAAMRLLNMIGLYAFNCRPTLSPLIGLRTVQVSITYGMCDVFAASLSSYGSLLCAFGDIEGGIRYGELSRQLLYKLDAKEWLGRVFSTKYGMIDPWRKPLRDSLAPLMRAHRSGLATGDVEFSMINAVLYSAISLFSGRPLSTFLPEMRVMLDLMKSRGQEGALAIFCPHMQTVLNFVGDVKDPLVLTGEVLNEELALRQANADNNTTLLLCIYLFKSMLAVHLNNFETAQKYLKLLSTFDQTGMSPYGKHEQMFLQAMASVALSKGPKRLRSAKRLLKKLQKQELQAPGNIKHKRLLIEAEIESKNGDLQMAREKYDQAIERAEKEGFLHDCAYACERAGYTMQTASKSCSDYFSRATDTYSSWGSFLKADATKMLVDKGNSGSTAMEDGSIDVAIAV